MRLRRLSESRLGEAGPILALCLTLTAISWWALDRQATAISEERFTTVATDISKSILRRLAYYEQVLRGGSALVMASDEVSREEWRIYVDRLAVAERYPGIQGIGFALRVDPGAVDEHVRQVRGEGFEEYSVHPEGERAHYFPIVFLEPFEARNRRAFGYDMYSEPIRRAAMSQAADSGKSVISGRVTLKQETGEDVQQHGTLLYVPVYRREGDLSTVEARRQALVGFVYSPFRMNDLLTGILGDRLGDVGVRVYDGQPAEDRVLFSNPAEEKSRYRYRQVAHVFGREWVIDIEARPYYQDELTADTPLVVLVGGLVISVLSMWLAQARIRERQRSTALERSNQDLAHARRVAETARREAEIANAAKSKFLAAASHDIRQPVQSMMLLIEVLGRQLGDHPGARLLEALDKSLDALRMLLNGLLDISKLDAGVVDVAMEPVPLDEVLRPLAAEYRLRAASQGLEFRVVPSRLWVCTDRVLAERILRNLIENALRYTDRGGILVGCRRHQDRVRIEIHDTGIGIPADQVSQIFQEFHQVGNPARDRSQGLGLGLAIVRRLAHMLDHHISVRSRLGRGSCFSVTLPVVEPRQFVAEAPSPSPPPPEAVAAGRLALVIDDEQEVRTGFRELFERWGYTVIAAGSAAEAEAAIATASLCPSIIIADYRLRGGETGTDAIRRVRQAVGAPVPAMIVTGDTAPERISEAEASGYHIVHKPVAPAELHAAVCRLIGEPAA